MTRSFIVSPHLSDAGTLTNGNDLTTLPATNLQTMQPSQVWRTEDLNTVWVQVDLGAAKEIDFIGLISCLEPAASDTYQVRASADSSPTTSPDYDSGSVNFFPGATKPSDGLFTRYHAFHLPSSAQTYRYWRIDITSTAAAGYWQQGRLFIGKRLDLIIQYGFGRGIDPADVVERTPYGGFLGDARGRPRLWTFQSEFLTRAGELQAHALDLMRGTAQDVFAVEAPDETTDLHHSMMQCALTEVSSINQPDFGLRIKNYSLREIL